MSIADYRFKGFLQLRVSPKRNVQLPSGWMGGAAGPMFIRLSREFRLPCIQVLPQAILEAERLAADPGGNLRVGKDQAICFPSENCHRVPIGIRDRLTLPRTWCDEAGIAYPGPVMIAGRGMSFEFWNPENFDRILEQELQI